MADILADMREDQPRPAPNEVAAQPLTAERQLDRGASPAAWILTCSGDDSVVLRLTAAGAEEILRANKITSYGTSAAGVMAFITHAYADGGAKLRMVDTDTLQVSRPLPIPDRPVEWMNGAAQGVVLTDRFAYYISLRYVSNEAAMNEKGGIANLQRIDRATGEARTFPLPRQTLQLFDFGGIPLVYSGYDVLKVDEKTGVLTALATQADMPDVVRWKGAAERERSPTGYPDFVAIEGAGVFRLSSVGALQHLLDADLNLIASPRPAVHAGAPQSLRGIFPGILEGRPVIGVIEESKDQTTLIYRDPLSLRSEWKVVLPRGADPYSLHPAGNALYYVDREAATVSRIAGDRAQPVWKLDAAMAARRCQPKVLRIEGKR